MMDFDKLEDSQKTFITNKVKELGDYPKVRRFYNNKDLVGAFARTTAIDIFGEGELEPWVDDLEIEQEKQAKKASKKKTTKKASKKKTSKKKARTVKKKRNIDADEVLAEE
jgi:hypothetical protein